MPSACGCMPPSVTQPCGSSSLSCPVVLPSLSAGAAIDCECPARCHLRRTPRELLSGGELSLDLRIWPAYVYPVRPAPPNRRTTQRRPRILAAPGPCGGVFSRHYVAMARFTLAGSTCDYLRPDPGQPPEETRPWEYGNYPKAMATLPLPTVPRLTSTLWPKAGTPPTGVEVASQPPRVRRIRRPVTVSAVVARRRCFVRQVEWSASYVCSATLLGRRQHFPPPDYPMRLPGRRRCHSRIRLGLGRVCPNRKRGRRRPCWRGRR